MFRKYLVITLLLFLSACGWRPLYLDFDEGNAQTARVEVLPVPNYEGRLLTQQLKDNLNPSNFDVPKLYTLSVVVAEQVNSDQGILADNTSTRATMTIRANFALKDKKSGALLLQNSVFSTASYNILMTPYSTVTAKQQTKQRLLNVIAGQISNHIAAYFQSQEEIAKDEN